MIIVAPEKEVDDFGLEVGVAVFSHSSSKRFVVVCVNVCFADVVVFQFDCIERFLVIFVFVVVCFSFT